MEAEGESPVGEEDTIRGRGIWEHFTVQDGLPDMKIECIAEDRAGYIWIGTHDRGVTRYDGQDFVTYTRSDGLAGDGVYSVLEDRVGHMWFGTNRGLTRYDGEHFETITTPEPCGFLWGSCVDREGNLWFGMDRRPGKPAAVVRWDGARAEVVEVRSDSREPGESITAVSSPTAGVLWLCGDSLYQIAGGELRTASRKVRLPRAIIPDEEGTVQVADLSGVWQVADSGEARQLLEVDTPGATSLFRDHGDVVWIASYDGSLRRSADSGHTVFASFYKPIQAVYVDVSDRVWVGTYGLGLLRCDQRRWKTFDRTGQPFLPTAVAFGSGLGWVASRDGLWAVEAMDKLRRVSIPFGESRDVTSVTLEATEGVWFGMRHGYVGRQVGGAMERCTNPPDALTHRIANLVCDGVTGRTWYTVYPGLGIGYYHGGRVRHFGPGNEEGFPQWVGAVHYDRSRGKVYLGTCEGRGDDALYAIDDLTPRRIGVTGDRRINAVLSTDEGIYLGTNGGLLLWEEGSAGPRQVGELPCEIVTCLSRGSDGTLWIGTEGGGVCRYDGTTLQTIAIPGGLLRNIVRDVTTDDRGIAWLATEGGLVSYCPRSWKPSLSVSVKGHGYVQPGNRGPVVSEDDSGVTLSFVSKSPAGSVTLPVYRYRQMGRESWEATSCDEVGLGRLARGDYSFEACAVDQDLNYSETVTIHLSVEPDARRLIVREALDAGVESARLLGESDAIALVRSQLYGVAKSELTVLILGETGTGKSIAAKFLHSSSLRKDGPFVQINCGAITESLAEAELFGHERGAFTGAVSKRVGKFQLADGGTVFLDEVGDLTPSLQAKLLHVLQDRRVEPVGAMGPIDVDVRVVAATNRNLESEVAAGRFRADLWYRLNAFAVVMPALRDRREDVSLLAHFFAGEFARHLDRACPAIAEDALSTLRSYEWPGNVRELEHMMQRAVVLCEGSQIGLHELPLSPRGGEPTCAVEWPTLREHERVYLEKALELTGGVVDGPSGVARLLGMNPSTLRSRLKKHGISIRRHGISRKRRWVRHIAE